MTALSADSDRSTRNEERAVVYEPLIATGVTVYKGSLAVVVSATRRARTKVAAATGTSRLVMGIYQEKATGTLSGGERSRVIGGIEAKIAGTLLTDGHIGMTVYALDDNTVTTLTNSGSETARQIAAGKLVARDEDDTDEFWVALGDIGIANAVA